MVRRLKSELNRRAEEVGEARPFTDRHVERITFNWAPEEHALVEALREYRRAGNAVVAGLGTKERNVGRFVFSLLTKRLLSCPYALARTWWAHIEGYARRERSRKRMLLAADWTLRRRTTTRQHSARRTSSARVPPGSANTRRGLQRPGTRSAMHSTSSVGDQRSSTIRSTRQPSRRGRTSRPTASGKRWRPG